jgi:hypothetical protein
MGDYGVNLLDGCETRMDWGFAVSKEGKFHNLFGWGQQTRGVVVHNTNDGKIKWDQWGGTCVTTVGQLLSFVTETGVDITGLGRWSWVRIGGGGKTSRVITTYQPCNPRWRTRGETVWDWHLRYFEPCGEIRNPQNMFWSDLISLLRQWKHAGDKIVLLGDFNKNVYTGALAVVLSSDDLHMHELCRLITGYPLPHTHTHGTVPINAVFWD